MVIKDVNKIPIVVRPLFSLSFLCLRFYSTVFVCVPVLLVV